MSKSYHDARSEEEMNRIFVEEVWEKEITRRLESGEICDEIDIQASIRSELEKRCLIGAGTGWCCFHNMQLLEPCPEMKGQGPHYDLVLMKYPREHDDTLYPAIVVELKIWNFKRSNLKVDLDKLDSLFDGDGYPLRRQGSRKGFCSKPYAVHLMCIKDAGAKKAKGNWGCWLKKQGKTYDVGDRFILAKNTDVIGRMDELGVYARYQDGPGLSQFLRPRDLRLMRITRVRGMRQAQASH